MKPIPRRLSGEILVALKHHPIVFLNGPRQAGKSTLVNDLADTSFPADVITFDNPTQLAAAASSPESFLRGRPRPLIIDEVQLVPELFRHLKRVVDEVRLKEAKRRNGRFLLTGSANVLALPKLADPLVGRMSVKTLYPFSASEKFGGAGDFPSRLFARDWGSQLTGRRPSLLDVMAEATFPEIAGAEPSVQRDWFDSYLATILQRDVRAIAEIEKIALLPKLLQLLASRAGQLMNDAEIARDLGMNPVTSKTYRLLLKSLFLTFDVPPWYRNIGKRLVKSAKGYFIDPLMLGHTLDLQWDRIVLRRPDLYGHIVENFVASELTKQLAFGDERATLHHFRTSDQYEVDFVLERPDGSLAGIEVKSSDQVSARDFKGLHALRDLTVSDFRVGIVLYGGREIVPFGDALFAVPITELWR